MAIGGHVTIADTGPIAAGSSGATTLDVLSGTGGNPVVFGDDVTITLNSVPPGIHVTGSLTGVANYTNPLTVSVDNSVPPNVVYNVTFDWVDVETPSKFGSGSFNVDVVTPLDASLPSDSSFTGAGSASYAGAAALTANSSVSASAKVTRFVHAALTANSSMVDNADFLLHAGLTANSSLAAAAKLSHLLHAALSGDSSFAADLSLRPFIPIPAAPPLPPPPAKFVLSAQILRPAIPVASPPKYSVSGGAPKAQNKFPR